MKVTDNSHKGKDGPPDVLAGPGHVVGRRSRRALTVDARSFTSDRGRIQKPARHRSRSENENFAQF